MLRIPVFKLLSNPLRLLPSVTFATPKNKRPPSPPPSETPPPSSKKPRKRALTNAMKRLTENPELFQAEQGRRNLVFPTKGGAAVDTGIDITFAKPDLSPVHEHDYFTSLGHKRKNVIDKEPHEKQRENETNYVDAYVGPKKRAIKYMTKEEREAVHLAITKRMQELEDTGLSRGEILDIKSPAACLTLKDDPFFQLVKTDRDVRESLIHPDEEFSVENVVQKSLEQNMGPDPSIAGTHRKYIDRSKLNDRQYLRQKMLYNKNELPVFEPEDTYYGTGYEQKLSTQRLYTREKPPTFGTMPMTRARRRKILQKRINRNEIVWHNTSLLSTFLNPAGRLYNRVQTHLKTSYHKRVRRMVMVARNLGLLPPSGTLKPSDKQNLKPIVEELHKFDLKYVDVKSGVLIFRDPQYTYKDMIEKGINMDSYNPEKPEFVKELAVDRDVKVPTFDQLVWIKAESHLKQEKGLTPPEAEAREKAFHYAEKMVSKLDAKKMMEGFLQERNLNHEYFEKAEDMAKDVSVKSEDLSRAKKRIGEMWKKYYGHEKREAVPDSQ